MDSHREALIQSFQAALLAGRSYERITEARTEAESYLGVIKPGSPMTKIVDEAMEAAVVRTATELIGVSQNTDQAYDRLVNLLAQQPRLGVKTSTSVLQQAYSTPMPIAFLAATLADIQPQHWVYEPTAGNGALLMTADADRVIANELNPDRFSELKRRGFRTLTQEDALSYRPTTLVDRVITNPPFGSLPDRAGGKQKFQTFKTFTTQIDQVIAFNALATLKPDGKAVLILGSKLGQDEASRSNRYHSRESRGFYKQLYDRYNVIDHFTLSGDLYRKQGAGFPIDLVVIDGRGRSCRSLPAADVPRIYNSFEQLKQEKLPHVPLRPHLQPIPTDLGTRRGESTPIRGESASDDRPPGLVAVSRTDGTAGAVDDQPIDRRVWRDGNPDQPNQRDRTHQHGATIPDETRRFAGMGRTVGGDLDSAQRSLSAERGDGFGLVSGQGDSTIDAGIRDTTMDSRGDAVRRMAEHPDHPLPMSNQAPESFDIEAKQVAYTPRSQAPAIGTLIPTNMAAPAQAALEQFEQRHGNIDDFLVGKLGYESREDMYQYFSGEQVDGAALAIDSIESGNAFINGYQTGIGKGRICAAIMRYAQQEGKEAIFVTQTDGLYADMIRDTRDIGMAGFEPFMTDEGKKINLPDGRRLESGKGEVQIEAMQEILNGDRQYDAVFTTYNQLQTVNQAEPFRRQFLRELAPRSILILDEAHEAGGTSQEGFRSKNAVPNRAEFARILVDLSSGAYFSSATAIKRPDVIDLYARKTDLRDAVNGDIDQLSALLESGGVPLQQMVAAGLTENGDMMRLERSFEGISFEPKVVAVDPNMAENLATAMRSIREFDEVKQTAVRAMDRELKEDGDRIKADNAIGDRGMSSTSFTSLMHNVIGQSLMAMKAEATVQECLASLEQGEKPVIAVDNTMASFIQWYAQENQIQPGEEIDITFADLLTRYLERSREVIVEGWDGESTRRPLTGSELGGAGVAAYGKASEVIRDSDFSTLPISPIDYIKHRLSEEGYTVGEVTGRNHILNYDADGATSYGTRSAKDTNANAKRATVEKFNSGALDAVILNRAGSTGISLHASETFADQRPRHMIILQAAGDVNQTMQMFGRVNRTGQVELPKYTLLMGDLPAEKRPGAILAKKMAQLNANTTAARDSDMSLKQVVDFFNPYGEQVVANVLSDEPHIDAMLGSPYEDWLNSESNSHSSLISKVTGRIPILPLAEQERIYERIETGYIELLESQKAMGANDLEAGRLNLDARTIAVMELSPATKPGPFTDAVRIEVLDVKAGGKPVTQIELINQLRTNVGINGAVLTIGDDEIATIHEKGIEQSTALIEQLRSAVNGYDAVMVAGREPDAVSKLRDKLATQMAHVETCLEDFPIGTAVALTRESGSETFGVIAKIEQGSQAKNPAAASNWRMTVAVPNGSKSIRIPLSQVNQDNDRGIQVEPMAALENAIYKDFDNNQTDDRIQLQMVTGNLIAGYSKIPQGRFINYTTNTGEVRQGLMLGGGEDIAKVLEKEGVKMPDTTAAKQFLGEWTQHHGVLKTNDNNLKLSLQTNGELVIATEKARAKGGKYYLDPELLKAGESEFTSVGNTMRMTVNAAQADAVLDVLMVEHGFLLFAENYQDIAKAKLGIATPWFIEVPAIAIPPIAVADRVNAEFVQASVFDAPELVLDQAVTSNMADAQTVLDIAARAYALGSKNGKVLESEAGTWIYAGKEFEFSYQPTSDTFTVSSLIQQTMVAQSIAGEISDDIAIEPAIVQRFEQLGQIMDDRGIPAAALPRDSYQIAAGIAANPKAFAINAEDLQQWHKQASQIERSPDYLHRLERTAAKATQTGNLPEAANQARLEDRGKWQQQVEGVIHHARSIVQTAGIPTQSGRTFAGAIFRIVADNGNSLAIHAKDRGVVLEVSNGQVITANITKQDADRFAKQAQAIQQQQSQPRAVGREH